MHVYVAIVQCHMHDVDININIVTLINVCKRTGTHGDKARGSWRRPLGQFKWAHGCHTAPAVSTDQYVTITCVTVIHDHMIILCPR